MRRLIATATLIILAGVAGCSDVGSATTPQGAPKTMAPVAVALRGFRPAAPGVLTVATNLPGPGFWDGNSPSVITGGFEYGMAQYMARALHLRLKIINVGWDGLVAGEIKGFDLALSTINITPARERVELFSIPYFASNQGVLVRAGTKVTGASAPTLIWGVEQSSTSYTYLTRKIKPLTPPRMYQDQPSMFAAWPRIRSTRCSWTPSRCWPSPSRQAGRYGWSVSTALAGSTARCCRKARPTSRSSTR